MTPLERLFERDGLARFRPARRAAEPTAATSASPPARHAIRRLGRRVVARRAAANRAPSSRRREADRSHGLLRAAADASLIAPARSARPRAIFGTRGGSFRRPPLFAQRGDSWPPTAAPLWFDGVGAIDVAQPGCAIRCRHLAGGRDALQGALPPGARLRVPDSSRRRTRLIELLHGEGCTVLARAAPSLFGELLARADHEVSSRRRALFGRWPDEQRKSLVAGRDLGGLEMGAPSGAATARTCSSLHAVSRARPMLRPSDLTWPRHETAARRRGRRALRAAWAPGVGRGRGLDRPGRRRRRARMRTSIDLNYARHPTRSRLAARCAAVTTL